jgi:hypothetical protein
VSLTNKGAAPWVQQRLLDVPRCSSAGVRLCRATRWCFSCNADAHDGSSRGLTATTSSSMSHAHVPSLGVRGALSLRVSVVECSASARFPLFARRGIVDRSTAKRAPVGDGPSGARPPCSWRHESFPGPNCSSSRRSGPRSDPADGHRAVGRERHHGLGSQPQGRTTTS